MARPRKRTGRRARKINLQPAMRSVKSPSADWDVPDIVSVTDLAGWFSLSLKQLLWLADSDDRRKRASHYHRRWIRKRSGHRLIEAPKPMLKAVQRQILDEILTHVPVSQSSCGFEKNKSVLNFVEPHIGKAVCLKMDLKNFFPSIKAGRIYRIFEQLGYPLDIVRLLTGLCTTVTSAAAIREISELACDGEQLNSTYSQRHLPQGSPASPYLANLCAFRMDRRLAGLASSINGDYSRYADDLLFSFPVEECDRQIKNRLKRLAHLVAVVAIEEGFDVNFRKTRVMFNSQRQMAAGIVLNKHANVCRTRYDQLQATLFNCVRGGPARS